MMSAVSFPFSQEFPSFCIPEAMENFDIRIFVYSMPSWNKCIRYITLSLSFIEVNGRLQRESSLVLTWSSQKR
jgi:hypothetical protein